MRLPAAAGDAKGKEERMRYAKKELRLFDVFSLVLAGLGILFVTFGVLASLGPRDVVSVEGRRPAGGKGRKSTEAVPSKEGSKAAYMGTHGRRYSFILLGVVFICLGTASNLGLRRVLRNKGEDVLEPHDEAREGSAGKAGGPAGPDGQEAGAKKLTPEEGA